MSPFDVQPKPFRDRFTFTRRTPSHATPKVIRRRGLRVLNLGRWLLTYAPRGHWSNHL